MKALDLERLGDRVSVIAGRIRRIHEFGKPYDYTVLIQDLTRVVNQLDDVVWMDLAWVEQGELDD